MDGGGGETNSGMFVKPNILNFIMISVPNIWGVEIYFWIVYKAQHFQFYPDICVKYLGVETYFWEMCRTQHFSFGRCLPVSYTHPRNILQPLPLQIVCSNIRIEWKTLGCTHFPEICFHLPSIWHEYQDKKKIPEIWFHPPNVWHEYQDRIENVAFYAHHRNMFTPPRMFCTNFRIEWIFGFSCVFVSPPHTHTQILAKISG